MDLLQDIETNINHWMIIKYYIKWGVSSDGGSF